MEYLVINPETFKVLIRQYGSARLFSSKSGAKRSLTSRINNLAKTKAYYVKKFGKDGFDNQSGKELEEMKKAIVIDEETFNKKEPMAIRKCLMSGETFIEPLNTPNFMSRSSESYWSM
nr:hypothetical protein [uncultured Mediterranean phage uvMED]